MSRLHEALESLRPKDFADVPLDNLRTYLPDILAKTELIANSVPPPPDGTPYESSRRSRSDANGARCAADLTISPVRRPRFTDNEQFQKAWGKPLKMGAKEAATGISVFKMAGHDRHGAWFARTSVHEGLGFAKWKKAMMREFPESLEVQGGPGEGNIRGIGGDKRLEDIQVDGIGKLEVYQLSAQFPGPTAPREFITLLLTSENGLSDASKVGNAIPRHYMVVSIPVTHDDAPQRSGMVRGQYESVEMIREIPLAPTKKASASTSDLLTHDRKTSRDRTGTISFAESRGPDAKGERIDRVDNAEDDDPETNPVEWIMITRSDPGGGIPRFMVERNTPASIVQDATKFLNWACSKDDFPSGNEEIAPSTENTLETPDPERRLSFIEGNGVLAGVGTSIADRPPSLQRPSYQKRENTDSTRSIPDAADPALASALNSLHRTSSQTSTISSSSLDSFASAEQYRTAPDGIPPPYSASNHSIPLTTNPNAARELEKIEEKRQQLHTKLEQSRAKQHQVAQNATLKSAKDLEKAAEKHNRSRKKQEEKYAKELQKLEARRERETKKLLARQQKEAERTALQKAQRERDEWRQRAELADREVELLREQIGVLQRENTALVARMGKIEGGSEALRRVREELEGGKGDHRKRAGSRSSLESGSGSGSGRSKEGHVRQTSGLSHMESPEE